jgi:hypothetical protein
MSAVSVVQHQMIIVSVFFLTSRGIDVPNGPFLTTEVEMG